MTRQTAPDHTEVLGGYHTTGMSSAPMPS